MENRGEVRYLRDTVVFVDHNLCSERWWSGGQYAPEDWDYESETHIVALDAFLREDERRDIGDHFRWTTETIVCASGCCTRQNWNDSFGLLALAW